MTSTGRSRPWGLWRRQALTVAALEMRKRFWGRSALALYALASIPPTIFALKLLMSRAQGHHVTTNLASADVLFAGTYRALFLRFVVFFGCVAVFTALFRGEVLDKSLHYYFLSPVRRGVLAVGKYVSGVVATVVLFGAATAAAWTLNVAEHGVGALVERLTSPLGLRHLGSYLLVTTLACIGYGAVFLAAGVFFRNPIVPALTILGWEGINFLLPPLLKKISVIHYLESLCPVPLGNGPISIVADPAPAWLAIPGIAALALALLYLSERRLRRTEILYGGE